MKKSRSKTNSTLTTYLLDVQPGLYTVLASTTGPDTTRFVKHNNRSLRQQQPAGQWQHLLTDGLGSVRSVIGPNLNAGSSTTKTDSHENGTRNRRTIVMLVASIFSLAPSLSR